jgi:CDP-archaeol synthase
VAPALQEFIDLPALALLVTANSTPVVLAKLCGTRWDAPVDASRMARDRRPLFGPHKTWRGLIGGALAAGLAGTLLGYGFALGAAFGALALSGDLGSSFVKRRLGRASGAAAPLLDQLPEALLPLVVLYEPLGLHAVSMTGTALGFMALDLILSRRFNSA